MKNFSGASLTQEEVLALRKDFPILGKKIREKTLVYLDNAATSQKPLSVIREQSRVYEELNANVHRGVHFLSQASTDAYEKSRRKVAEFLGVKEDKEIIFTRGTTESINLVASSWGKKYLNEGDAVVVTRMEHHSNFVPWQALCEEKRAKFLIWEIEENYTLDLNKLEEILKSNKVKMIAVTALSNVLGVSNPIADVSKLAKKYGALVLVDAAQACAHGPISLKSWDVDFLALSSHKMCGPTGIGILWGKKNLLEAMPPYQYGGDMILRVEDKNTSWNELPWKFEAGTPNYGDSIAFGAALDYLKSIGLDRIAKYEMEISLYAIELLRKIPHIHVLVKDAGNYHGGVVSFTTDKVHPHDLATFLDVQGVAIRAGHHCAQPLMRTLGTIATNRASFYFYNTKQEAEFLAEAVVKAMEYFG